MHDPQARCTLLTTLHKFNSPFQLARCTGQIGSGKVVFYI